MSPIHPPYPHDATKVPQKRYKLSQAEVRTLRQHGHLIDARHGGFVIGPRHADGGVKCVVHNAEGYVVFMEIEGGEYLLNVNAFEEHRKAVLELRESALHDPTTGIDTPATPARVLDTRPHAPDLGSKYLLIPLGGNMMVLSRRATAERLEWLDGINERGLQKV